MLLPFASHSRWRSADESEATSEETKSPSLSLSGDKHRFRKRLVEDMGSVTGLQCGTLRRTPPATMVADKSACNKPTTSAKCTSGNGVSIGAKGNGEATSMM